MDQNHFSNFGELKIKMSSAAVVISTLEQMLTAKKKKKKISTICTLTQNHDCLIIINFIDPDKAYFL